MEAKAEASVGGGEGKEGPGWRAEKPACLACSSAGALELTLCWPVVVSPFSCLVLSSSCVLELQDVLGGRRLKQ